MKAQFILFTILLMGISRPLYSQTVAVSGNIDSNTNWDADTVQIIGDVSVSQGITLLISPGTYIEAEGYFKIDVYGQIKANGSQVNPITFSVRDSSNFWEDTLSTQGGWGGVNIFGIIPSTDTNVFEYCVFNFGKKYDSNNINNYGGAINAQNHGIIKVTNCIFRNNMAIGYTEETAGGAIYCKSMRHVSINGNSFKFNRSFDSGGAISIDNDCENVIIKNNLFVNNTSISFQQSGGYIVINGDGAAVSIHDNIGSSPIICNNQFYNNSSVNGVIYISSLNALVFNNVVCNNFCDALTDGHQLSTSNIFNNTVVNNLVYNGGFQLFSSANVYNNIVWGNINGYTGQLATQINVTTVFPIHPHLFNNCVDFGNGGTNAVYTDPDFINPSTSVGPVNNYSDIDWSVTVYSPCINAGVEDTTGLFIPLIDIIGDNRIYPARIDIGAFENNSLWLKADNDKFDQKSNIYPNPGSAFLNIYTDHEISGALFTLYNMKGQTFLKQPIENSKQQINTSQIPAGTYLWHVVFKNKIIESGKWIKE
jgi:hypothetical protein